MLLTLDDKKWSNMQFYWAFFLFFDINQRIKDYTAASIYGQNLLTQMTKWLAFFNEMNFAIIIVAIEEKKHTSPLTFSYLFQITC